MKLLIEEHDYPAESVKKLFPNIDELDPVDGMVRVNYVGYYYHAAKGESVFILPKVVLDKRERQGFRQPSPGRYNRPRNQRLAFIKGRGANLYMGLPYGSIVQSPYIAKIAKHQAETIQLFDIRISFDKDTGVNAPLIHISIFCFLS